jgi:hypothetical protein
VRRFLLTQLRLSCETAALKYIVLREEFAANGRFVMFGCFERPGWLGWDAARGKAAL